MSVIKEIIPEKAVISGLKITKEDTGGFYRISLEFGFGNDVIHSMECEAKGKDFEKCVENISRVILEKAKGLGYIIPYEWVEDKVGWITGFVIKF